MYRFKQSLHWLQPNCYKKCFFSHLQNAGPMASLLKTRSVIRFTGPDTLKFLQGLVTNDVRRLGDPQPEDRTTLATTNVPFVSVPPVYAALLTPQGRFLYDMFLYRPPKADEKLDRAGTGPPHDTGEVELFADVDGSELDELMQILKTPLVEADKEINEENYLLWRLEKGVAEGSAEIPKGEAVPLEYNLAGLNGISFDKGCYVGQELIARTHHRGVIRKRLLPLKFVNDSGKEMEQKVAPKSEVIDASSGKKAGTVTTALGSRGLGLLRLDEAFKDSLTIQGLDDVKVKAIKPEWWPAEWLSDQQEQTAAA